MQNSFIRILTVKIISNTLGSFPNRKFLIAAVSVDKSVNLTTHTVTLITFSTTSPSNTNLVLKIYVSKGKAFPKQVTETQGGDGMLGFGRVVSSTRRLHFSLKKIL
jgi:hypothetical protein